MTNEPKEPVCDECRPLVDAFTAYSQDLDDYIRLITDLCIAVTTLTAMSAHTL